MENNTPTGWEPEEQTPTTMNEFNEQTKIDEDDTTPEDVEPVDEDDDMEDGNLDDSEPEEEMDESGTSNITEELVEDEPNEETDNLDSEYKTSPQGAI